jgi:predicted porin
VTGFGNQLNDGLAALGTNFAVRRNPLGGDLTGCAFGEGNAFCFDNALQSAVAAPFRARGVSASYSYESGPWNAGIAAGYQEREFLTSNLGALANLDGVSDESYFVGLSVGRQLDEKSSIQGNVFANYLESGLSPDGTFAIGGNASYNRQIFRGLSGTAAVGIDYFEQQGFDSATTASALLGLRYDF